MLRQGKCALCVGLSELQAYTRVETGEEEAVLASLLRVATELCEGFLNQALLPRDFEQDLTAGRGWDLLGIQPVRTISEVRAAGGAQPLDESEYRVDIDHDGRAFISGLPAGSRYVVKGTAGMGETPNDVPEPIRQGILRLTAHYFTNRDSAAGELPKAVTALWRPYRRAGLSR